MFWNSRLFSEALVGALFAYSYEAVRIGQLFNRNNFMNAIEVGVAIALANVATVWLSPFGWSGAIKNLSGEILAGVFYASMKYLLSPYDNWSLFGWDIVYGFVFAFLGKSFGIPILRAFNVNVYEAITGDEASGQNLDVSNTMYPSYPVPPYIGQPMDQPFGSNVSPFYNYLGF